MQASYETYSMTLVRHLGLYIPTR